LKKEWLLLLPLLLLVSCQERGPAGGTGGTGGERTALEASPLYRHFVKIRPGKAALIWAFRDLNADGCTDLLVIYSVAPGKNAMLAVLDRGGDCIATNEVPAPVSDQTIVFRDIDEKPPVEFIVQGMKGTKVGYAVYRIENGRLVDLFSEGMDACC
jgi:hypothetical protein